MFLPLFDSFIVCVCVCVLFCCVYANVFTNVVTAAQTTGEKEAILLSRLEGVFGHVCEFPLDFLKNSRITSLTYSVVVGAEVFQ
jgi:hypothetical protein